jgi:hypothetical protein
MTSDEPTGEDRMKIFKKRQKPTTHIVKRKEQPASPLTAAVTGGINRQYRGWEIKRDEFRTFDSPPGRF